jgi:hypothetical protein
MVKEPTITFAQAKSKDMVAFGRNTKSREEEEKVCTQSRKILRSDSANRSNFQKRQAVSWGRKLQR